MIPEHDITRKRTQRWIAIGNACISIVAAALLAIAQREAPAEAPAEAAASLAGATEAKPVQRFFMMHLEHHPEGKISLEPDTLRIIETKVVSRRKGAYRQERKRVSISVQPLRAPRAVEICTTLPEIDAPPHPVPEPPETPAAPIGIVPAERIEPVPEPPAT